MAPNKEIERDIYLIIMPKYTEVAFLGFDFDELFIEGFEFQRS